MVGSPPIQGLSKQVGTLYLMFPVDLITVHHHFGSKTTSFSKLLVRLPIPKLYQFLVVGDIGK